MRAARSSATNIRRVGHGPAGPNDCGPRPNRRRRRRCGWHHGHRPRASAWCITATDNTTRPNTSGGAAANRSGNRSTRSTPPVTVALQAGHRPPTGRCSPRPATAPARARPRPRARAQVPRHREAPEPHAAPPHADSHHRPTNPAAHRQTRCHPLQHRTIAVGERTVGSPQRSESHRESGVPVVPHRIRWQLRGHWRGRRRRV